MSLLRAVGNIGDALTRTREILSSKLNDPALMQLFGAGSRKVVVNEHSAQTHVVVGACIHIISSDIATMPYGVFKKTGKKRERLNKHPLGKLFSGMVNPYMDTFTFCELRVEDLLTWGNFYAFKILDRRGRIVALYPIKPWAVRPELLDDGRKVFHVMDKTGSSKPYDSEEIYHVMAPGSRGVKGQSVIRKHALSIGVGMKTEVGLDSFLENGARSNGYMTMPGKMEKTALEQLRTKYKGKFTGYERFGEIPIFDNGLEWKSISVPLHDIAFLQQAKYSDVKVAMMFRTPLYKLGIMDQAKFNNLEQLSTEYYSNTLHGWIRRIEIADHTQLFTPEEQEDIYTKHNVSAFLRGDTAARWRSYDLGRKMGVYSANDILELEDRDPIEGEAGDMRIVPSNMMSIEKMVDFDPGNTGSE